VFDAPTADNKMKLVDVRWLLVVCCFLFALQDLQQRASASTLVRLSRILAFRSCTVGRCRPSGHLQDLVRP